MERPKVLCLNDIPVAPALFRKQDIRTKTPYFLKISEGEKSTKIERKYKFEILVFIWQANNNFSVQI